MLSIILSKVCGDLIITPICALNTYSVIITSSGEGFPVDFRARLWLFAHSASVRSCTDVKWWGLGQIQCSSSSHRCSVGLRLIQFLNSKLSKTLHFKAPSSWSLVCVHGHYHAETGLATAYNICLQLCGSRLGKAQICMWWSVHILLAMYCMLQIGKMIFSSICTKTGEALKRHIKTQWLLIHTCTWSHAHLSN